MTGFATVRSPHARRPRAGRAALVLALAALTLAAAGGPRASTGLPVQGDVIPATAGAAAGRVAVVIELSDEPGARAYADVLARAAVRDEPARAAAASAARAQIDRVDAAQQQVAALLAAPRFGAVELFRVRRAMNAIAARVDPADLATIRRLPGVKAVHALPLEYPTNATSVPFIGTPALWSDTLGLGGRLTGDGVRVGVIDSGIDYQHADFGGRGRLADYQANNRTVAPDAFFPTAKVVGGWDFVGDAYTGANTPTPDADPMDCNGHGTHVAGTLAGFGVAADGTTFAGPYSRAVPFASLRIGPGVAPRASLYALRVLGCTGGTNVTIQAIDWAMDPNNDNDLSDHLDVLNLSLGTDFGSVSAPTAIAADYAAAAGIIVVTSAGNSGDTYFISGSPGAGSRVIATAASADSGAPGAVRVNAPSAIAGDYQTMTASFGPQPPAAGVTGAVAIALDPANGDGPSTTDACSPLTNPAAVAGRIALVDRGSCAFTAKVRHAQDAGAIAVIVANNGGTFATMPGTDATIVIPAVMVAQADGMTMKNDVAGLDVTVLGGGDTLGRFSSRGPRGGGSGPAMLKPDIAAPGVAIVSARTGVTCTTFGCQAPSASGYAAGNLELLLDGTSMAAPHVAGVMTLLRQLHPAWTVEELKALAMNRALHDVSVRPGGAGARYGPGRIGAGRVDAALAAQSSIVAFNADGEGLVSVSFDVKEVVGTAMQTKTIRLVNHGAEEETYQIGIDTVVDAPGVSFSLPGGGSGPGGGTGSNSVTVPAGRSIELPVRLDADASRMDHTHDATIDLAHTVTAPSSIDGVPVSRHWLTEASAYLTLSQGGHTSLRVPLYATARAASAMSGPAIVATGGSAVGSGSLPLAGTDVCTGARGGGPAPACNGSFPLNEQSLVSPFELQVVSPRDPSLPAATDLQYAGIAADASRLYFGLSTWGDWGSPSDVSFSIYVDTNFDGAPDRVIFTTNSGALARLFGQTQSDLDTFITAVLTPPGSVSATLAAGVPSYINRVSPAAQDTALFNSNVLFVGVTPAQLGLGGTNVPFAYRIETCPGHAPLCGSLNGYHYDQADGPFTWSGQPALDFGGATLLPDLDGAAIPVSWNTANLASNGTRGALLLHHHNRAGERAQVLAVEGTPYTDLGITMAAQPAAPASGEPVTLAITVTNHGSNSASGIQVTTDLPSSLRYISNDAGGAYNDSAGIWNVAALSPGRSATLHLIVSTTDGASLTARAAITAASLLDPVPSNNQAAVGLALPPAADLQITAAPIAPSTVAGNQARYLITLHNNGDSPAYNVLVTHTLSGAGAIQSGVPSDGLFDVASAQWTIASLAPRASATLTLVAQASAGPALTVQAHATSAVADPFVSNNAATAIVTVAARATMVGSVLTPSTVLPDETSVMTVTVIDVDAAGPATVPTGAITFASSNTADVFPNATCILVPVPAASDRASCQVTIAPANVSGVRTLTATYTGSAIHAAGTTMQDLAVTETPTRTYLLAEGATGPFFDLDLLLANPNPEPAPVEIKFLKETGPAITQTRTLLPMSRTTIRADDIPGLESATFSIVVTSTANVPIVVERTMTWDPTGYGAHTEKAVDGPAQTWYFAEGATGFFSTYFLLANPNSTANTAHVTYFREGEPSLRRDYVVGPFARRTIDAGADPELAYRTFGAVVSFDQPGAAERSMYFGVDRFWSGGTEAAGVTAPSRSWYLAEGATGTYFTTFILLANPNDDPATVTIDYLPLVGTPVAKTYTLPARQRVTLNVALQDPTLAAAAVGAHVESDRPILVERAQYWPQPVWFEGHSSAGVTSPGLRWGLAEGRVGGPHLVQTYILLMNPGPSPAAVTLTMLRVDGTTVVKTFVVRALSRYNVAVGGPGSDVPELEDEPFGTLIESTQPIVVERSMYGDANGVTWASGTNATATRLP